MSDNIIKSIEKAVEILDCFYENEVLGITEISNLIGYSKSTVHDTIYTLTQLGLIHKNEETKKYSLGIKLFEYGSLYSQRNSLRKNFKSIGRTLSDKYQATCHLATFDKNEIIYLDKFEYQGAIVTSYTHVGKRIPMTITGLGKAILAYLPEDYRYEEVYAKGMQERTPYSITDVPTMEAELKEIKENGYAIDNEESVLGLRCVACPIFDEKGNVIAALSVALLAPYFLDSLIPKISQEVSFAAKQLTSLGY